ncbi:MAG: mandelate racemase/muconate lactonizing enzyme family protein [Chitinophagaceae bacterium]
METNRRKFIGTALVSGLSAALPLSSRAKAGAEDVTNRRSESLNPHYARLDKILAQPVLKKILFTTPVIIQTLELLRFNDDFLCRVRSKDGAEGLSVGNSQQLKSLYPIFVHRLQPFFIGKDARNLDTLLEEVYVYGSNYKLQSLALWVPLATIEFAILDMLGKIAGKPMGQLIGEIYNPRVAVYSANSDRNISVEETMDRIHKQVEESQAKAIKLKVGGRMSAPETPPGRTEKLIPTVRKTYGDKMVLYADSNGSYSVEEAIKIGRIMEDNQYAFYEEPVPFDWYEETKQVADALTIPIAGGEQEASLHAFRWLIANNALDIVQPDMFYFGGMIRSIKVARMAEALGKICTPHISGEDLGYIYMMHFISAIPNAGPFHEFKGFDNGLPATSSTSSLKSENGIFKVPTGPGLGVEIDIAYIQKHKVVKG